MTKRVLKQKEIPFQERDLLEDPSALELAKSLGHLAAPVVIVGDQHWSGFRPDLLNKLAA